MGNSIRVIQYLGSKIRILDDIKREIDRVTVNNGVVVDLFAGTGVVASYLAKDYCVLANDIQEYSSLIANVLINNLHTDITYEDLIKSESYIKNKKTLQKLFKDILVYESEVLKEKNCEKLAALCVSNVFYNGENIEQSNYNKISDMFGSSLDMFTEDKIEYFRRNKEIYALFTLYFSNSYFSVEQCIEIDSLRKAIDELSSDGLNESDDKKVLLVCLMHAVSECVSSVGKNFAQPIKVIDGKGNVKRFAINRCMRDRMLSIGEEFKIMLSDLNTDRAVVRNNNEVLNLDAMEFMNTVDISEVETFYLDPPYTIDHYSRFYHALETLVKYDYPVLEEKTFRGKKYLMNGRYRNDRVQSNYCIPSKGKNEFSILIHKIAEKRKNIVMSYSDSDDDKDTRKRVVSKDELLEILYLNYPYVEQKNITHKYRKLSSKESNRKEYEDSELLFTCHF